MKVLVCGSVEWTDAQFIERRLCLLPRGTHIISGGARGADQLAASIGRGLGFQVTEFPANWRPSGVYNPRAGFERNIRMLEQEPDLIIGFQLNGSGGTQHTVDEASKRRIAVELHRRWSAV